jgi:hypothetical protein
MDWRRGVGASRSRRGTCADARRSILNQSLDQGLPWRLACCILLLGTLGIGCQQDYFRVTSDSDPNVDRRFTLGRFNTTGAGPKYLGSVSGDMGEVGYRADGEKRMYLLDSRLEGLRQSGRFDVPVFPTTGQFVRLPASDGVERGFDITDLDPSKPWRSARVYDVGMCSSLVPLNNPIISLVAEIPDRIAEQIRDHEQTSGEVKLHSWKVEPILRMVPGPIDGDTGIMRKDADALQVEMSVRVDQFAGGIGNFWVTCFNAQVDIRFTLILDVVHRVAVDNRRCLPPSLPFQEPQCPEYNLAELELPIVSGPAFSQTILDEDGRLCTGDRCVQCFWIGDDPNIGAIRPHLYGLEVSVSQFGGRRCRSGVQSQIVDAVTEAMHEELRTGFERAISEIMLHASINAGSCRADCDCVQTHEGRLVPGARWECAAIDDDTGLGTCRPVIEADRVHLRPDPLLEGTPTTTPPRSNGVLEIVVAEDENDLQAWWLPFVSFGAPLTGSGCNPGRLAWPAGSGPDLWQVRWPFVWPPEAGIISLSDGPGDEERPRGPADDPGARGPRGRGPGAAAPPGQGEGLEQDRGTGQGSGRGTGAIAAPGHADPGCDSLCECLVDAHDLDLHDCVAACRQFVSGIRSNQRRDTCHALFQDLDLEECRDRCDDFGPSGGRVR